MIPRPIFSLNSQLLERMTDGRIVLGRLYRDRPGLFSAGIGYRFERTHPDESVRLECSLVHLRGNRQAIVHNYGHGGAGYTLSWGCAKQVRNLVNGLIRDGWPMPESPRTDPQDEFRASADMLAGLLATGPDEEYPKGIAR